MSIHVRLINHVRPCPATRRRPGRDRSGRGRAHHGDIGSAVGSIGGVSFVTVCFLFFSGDADFRHRVRTLKSSPVLPLPRILRDCTYVSVVGLYTFVRMWRWEIVPRQGCVVSDAVVDGRNSACMFEAVAPVWLRKNALVSEPEIAFFPFVLYCAATRAKSRRFRVNYVQIQTKRGYPAPSRHPLLYGADNTPIRLIATPRIG